MAKRKTYAELADYNLHLLEACEIAQKSADGNLKKMKRLDKQFKQAQKEAGRLRGLLAAQGKHLEIVQQQLAATVDELQSMLEWTEKKRSEWKQKHQSQAEELKMAIAQLDSYTKKFSDIQAETTVLKAALHITTKD